MCETKGFISPKTAGKLVKCCNPECLVPIFKAPAIEKKEPVAAPPEPQKKLPWLYIAGGLCFAVIAVVSVVVKNQQGVIEIPPIKIVLPNQGLPPETGTETAANDNTQDGKTGVKRTNDQEPAGDGRSQIVQEALQRLDDSAPKLPGNQNQKSWWRRLAATAHIHSGDLKGAGEQLDLLEKRGSTSPSEGVLPVALLAWREAPGTPEFNRAVDRVRKLAAQLPKRGLYATAAAVATAPLFVVSEKTDEARKLLASHDVDKFVKRLAGAIQIVVEDGTFNLDTKLPGRHVGDWQSPFECSVTLLLANHGRWDDAYAWATTAADPLAKAEATILWAETFARRAVPPGDVSGFERALKAADGLASAGKARLLARLAAVKISAGDRAGAAELIAEAKKELAATAVPKPVKVHSDAKALYDLKLPAPVPYIQAALAATEIAGAQSQLAQSGEAWESILLANRYLHGIAPSAGDMNVRSKDLEKELAKGSTKIHTELARAMGIKKDKVDEIRQHFNRYKEKCHDVDAAAKTRFFWEGVVFEAAADFGLLEQVWDALQVLDHKPDVHEQEPFLSTAVPLFVAARFAEAGNEAQAADINKAVASRVDALDPQVIIRESEALFRDGHYQKSIRRLGETMAATPALQEWALRLACRLVVAGKPAEAIAYCNEIKDISLRGEGLYLIAALAARRDLAPELWKASARMVSGMDAAALCSGLIAGLNAPSLSKETVDKKEESHP